MQETQPEINAPPDAGIQRKAPAGFGGASSLQGLKTRDYPASRNPYSWVGLTSNQFPVGRCFLRLPVAFALQHAGRNCGTLDAASEALTLGAHMRVLLACAI